MPGNKKNVPSNDTQGSSDVSDSAWMAWLDGESEPAPPDAGDSPRSAHVTQVVDAVGAAVHAYYEGRAEAHEQELSDMWAEISTRIAEDPPARPGGSHPAAPVASPPGQGWGRWITYGLTAAVSAGFASLLTLGLVDPPRSKGPTPPVSIRGGGPGSDWGAGASTAVPVPVPAPALVPAVLRTPPTIESLEVEGSSTIITVEDADGAATIIWVNDTASGETL